MKNITLALDDTTYRNARIAAARRDTSVSALVKQYLITLAETENPPLSSPPQSTLPLSSPPQCSSPGLETLLDDIAKQDPDFSCDDNISRDAH